MDDAMWHIQFPLYADFRVDPRYATALHVLPILDCREHLTTCECWCNAEHDDIANLITHNSADGREAYELGIREPH